MCHLGHEALFSLDTVLSVEDTLGNVFGQWLSAITFFCEGMMAGILAACFKTRVFASEEAQFCQRDETQAEFLYNAHWERWKGFSRISTKNQNNDIEYHKKK